MTKARRLRIYIACNGRCVCGVKVPMEGTVIDHPTQLWLGGSDEDHLLKFLCNPCNKQKTAKDATVRAKVKRIIAKSDPDTRKPSRMKSRPFPKGSRPIPSRKFGQ
jgi:5-methylcytosine-specific restriction endonuclease McrA